MPLCDNSTKFLLKYRKGSRKAKMINLAKSNLKEKMKKKPLILVTNDDGITAPGLRALIKVMNEIGDVVVVAPDSPQSAMGHAITINSTLYCEPIDIDHEGHK